MKIQCAHGYFRFEESRGGELSEFVSMFGLKLERKGDYFTFSDLIDAPDFSIQGAAYMDTVAIKTFAGQPWEIFEANQIIYNYDLGLVVPILSVTNIISLVPSGTFYYCNGLILPGSLTTTGQRIKSYAAWFSPDNLKFKFSEVSFVD